MQRAMTMADPTSAATHAARRAPEIRSCPRDPETAQAAAVLTLSGETLQAAQASLIALLSGQATETRRVLDASITDTASEAICKRDNGEFAIPEDNYAKALQQLNALRGDVITNQARLSAALRELNDLFMIESDLRQAIATLQKVGAGHNAALDFVTEVGSSALTFGGAVPLFEDLHLAADLKSPTLRARRVAYNTFEHLRPQVTRKKLERIPDPCGENSNAAWHAYIKDQMATQRRGLMLMTAKTGTTLGVPIASSVALYSVIHQARSQKWQDKVAAISKDPTVNQAIARLEKQINALTHLDFNALSRMSLPELQKRLDEQHQLLIEINHWKSYQTDTQVVPLQNLITVLNLSHVTGDQLRSMSDSELQTRAQEIRSAGLQVESAWITEKLSFLANMGLGFGIGQTVGRKLYKTALPDSVFDFLEDGKTAIADEAEPKQALEKIKQDWITKQCPEGDSLPQPVSLALAAALPAVLPESLPRVSMPLTPIPTTARVGRMNATPMNAVNASSPVSSISFRASTTALSPLVVPTGGSTLTAPPTPFLKSLQTTAFPWGSHFAWQTGFQEVGGLAAALGVSYLADRWHFSDLDVSNQWKIGLGLTAMYGATQIYLNDWGLSQLLASHLVERGPMMLFSIPAGGFVDWLGRRAGDEELRWGTWNHTAWSLTLGAAGSFAFKQCVGPTLLQTAKEKIATAVAGSAAPVLALAGVAATAVGVSDLARDKGTQQHLATQTAQLASTSTNASRMMAAWRSAMALRIEGGAGTLSSLWHWVNGTSVSTADPIAFVESLADLPSTQAIVTRVAHVLGPTRAARVQRLSQDWIAHFNPQEFLARCRDQASNTADATQLLADVYKRSAGWSDARIKRAAQDDKAYHILLQMIPTRHQERDPIVESIATLIMLNYIARNVAD